MPINFKDYNIVKKCEGNGINKIYVVQKKGTKTYFIVKIIKLEDKKKQLREIDIHKKLNHKYVVKLLDYDIEKDKIIMLIEYARYGDLFGFLKKFKNFKEQKTLKFFYKIIQSILYLHKKKLVHRDIKPENIMITKQFRPKLGDFGTSGRKKEIKNTFCGTYEYMAPEIYMRLKQTEKVDIWALGVLLYEITHMKTPFKNKTLQDIKKIVLNKEIKFKKGINVHIKKFIYFALNFDPKRRPSCEDLLNHELFDCIKKTTVNNKKKIKLFMRENITVSKNFFERKTKKPISMQNLSEIKLLRSFQNINPTRKNISIIHKKKVQSNIFELKDRFLDKANNKYKLTKKNISKKLIQKQKNVNPVKKFRKMKSNIITKKKSKKNLNSIISITKTPKSKSKIQTFKKYNYKNFVSAIDDFETNKKRLIRTPSIENEIDPVIIEKFNKFFTNKSILSINNY